MDVSIDILSFSHTNISEMIRIAELDQMFYAMTLLEVIQEALPAYFGKHSKYIFTPSRLMTVLCLMRFEDWAFHGDAAQVGHAFGLGL